MSARCLAVSLRRCFFFDLEVAWLGGSPCPMAGTMPLDTVVSALFFEGSGMISPPQAHITLPILAASAVCVTSEDKRKGYFLTSI